MIREVALENLSLGHGTTECGSHDVVRQRPRLKHQGDAFVALSQPFGEGLLEFKCGVPSPTPYALDSCPEVWIAHSSVNYVVSVFRKQGTTLRSQSVALQHSLIH